MPAIQLTDSGAGVGVTQQSRALARAAVAALGAPSILNTQPWQWRIGSDTAELRADRTRQVTSIDPGGRLLTVSCGIALHHAVTALHAGGYDVTVARLPDADDPDLLATVRITGQVAAPAEQVGEHVGPAVPDRGRAVRLFRAMAVRRSDRRPFDAREVGEDALLRLREAAESNGAHLHLPRPDALVALTVAAGRAATVELADPAYRADLRAWVGPSRDTGDGVPSGTAAAAAARPVPIRDFTASGPETTSLFDQLALGDTAARYAVLFTDGDDPLDWLVAGEALSAVLLTATADGLSSSMLSDLVEVDSSRNILRDLLGHIGHPVLVIRLGYPTDNTRPPRTPRRRGDEAVQERGFSPFSSG